MAADEAAPAAGWAARIPLALLAVGGLSGSAADAVPVLVAAAVLLAVDAVRRDEPDLAVVAAGLSAPIVFVAGEVGGLDVAERGLTMVVMAAVFVGLAGLTERRWQVPVLAGAACCAGAGLLLATESPIRFAQSLVVAGMAIAGVGIVLRRNLVAHLGGPVALGGLAVHLDLSGIHFSEAYLAPVAAQLALLGWQVRRSAPDTSSWVAYGPSIGLVGISALGERMAGGPSWHALIAGAVGIAAVAVGGWQRLAGPLFLGTGLVVTVTITESLHALAGVPTWAWLAAGGTALLAAGIAMERADTSPVEAGRRLVDVVGERFE